MEWIGWVLAVIAIGAAVWLRRQLVAERAHNNELVCEKLEADNRFEALDADQAAKVDPGLFVDNADRLGRHLHAVDETVQQAKTALSDYRECVKQFDAAVQYCLQPVELIFGADKASLDQLVHHVEGARRKLFDARTLMDKHPLHRTDDALDGLPGIVRELATQIDELRARALATPADVAAATDAPPAKAVAASATP